MQIRSNAVLDFLTILGAVILFLAWAFQQTLLNNAKREVANITSVQAAFETYQSHNALFNALAAAVPNASSEILRFQTVNYNFAFDQLEKLLTSEERARLPPRAGPLDGDWNPVIAEQKTQSRIDAIWPKIDAKKLQINTRSAEENKMFLGLYFLGSLLALSTSAYKAFFQTKT
jgi:hypothetical protein